MVLAYWGTIGVLAGLLAYLFLRSQGEQGYNVIGEVLLGVLGALALAMSVGVLEGWGQMFARGEIKYDQAIASGITAIMGSTLVLGIVIIMTLRSSPTRHQD